MQSQLAAALLGHNTNATTSTAGHVDEDENNSMREEDADLEQMEEFDEETESETPSESQHENGCEKHTVEIRQQVVGKDPSNRTVTLQMLLSAGILKPGAGAMTIEYLGQKFVGDLLEDGKIRSQETDIIFASPSAWAIACKRFINPDKKSGCGWASVKYQGKKLDAYKNVWYKKKKEEEKELEKQLEKEVAAASNLNLEQLLKTSTSVPTTSAVTVTSSNTAMFQRFVVKHNTISNRTLTHDANTMIECIPFSNLGKIQPFLVSLHTNAAFLMDFHCHLTKSEVSGYLAGHWEVNSHNLLVTHAFPCRNTKTDRANAPQVEAEILKSIEREKLTLIGWYHSHPYAAAAPTLRDVDAQLEYQIKMRGTQDNSYTPCIGIIVSPYNYENVSLESSILSYWIIPPPETKPNEYGRPMLMSYSVIQDSVLTPFVKTEVTKCVEYYRKEPDFVNFNEKFIANNLYIEKLKATLISKFPREENENDVWKFIKEVLNCSIEEKEMAKPMPIATFTAPGGLGVFTSDISSLLFNPGKFPGSGSLLGLPDPMAHSTLAANNVFLQTNLFKMQELFKPLASNAKSKTGKANASASRNFDFPSLADLNYLTKTSSGGSKTEFYAPNVSSNKASTSSDYSLNLSNVGRHSQSPPLEDEKPSKFVKIDYAASCGGESGGMLDLSCPKGDIAMPETAKDLSVTENVQSDNGDNDAPLNLGFKE